MGNKKQYYQKNLEHIMAPLYSLNYSFLNKISIGAME